MNITAERKAEILGLIKGAALMSHKRASETPGGPGGLKELASDQPVKKPVKKAPTNADPKVKLPEESPEKSAAVKLPEGSQAYLLGRVSGFVNEMEPREEVMMKIATALKLDPNKLYAAYWEKVAMPWLPLLAGGAAAMAAPALWEGAKGLGRAVMHPINSLLGNNQTFDAGNWNKTYKPFNMAQVGGVDPQTSSMMNKMMLEQSGAANQQKAMLGNMREAFNPGAGGA